MASLLNQTSSKIRNKLMEVKAYDEAAQFRAIMAVFRQAKRKNQELSRENMKLRKLLERARAK